MKFIERVDFGGAKIGGVGGGAWRLPKSLRFRKSDAVGSSRNLKKYKKLLSYENVGSRKIYIVKVIQRLGGRTRKQ